MKAHEAEKLIETIRGFVESTGNHAKSPEHGAGSRKAPDNIAPAASERINDAQVEKLYAQIKNRLLDDLRVDPVFVQLLANVPEIVVELTPRVITLEGDSLKGRLARLIAGGFFDDARKQGTARAELARTGPDCNSGNLSRAMTDFVADGFLTREGESFVKAPGLKGHGEDDRSKRMTDPVIHGIAELFVDELIKELPALAVEVAASRLSEVDKLVGVGTGRAVFRSQLIFRAARAMQDAVEETLDAVREEVLTGRRK